MSCRQWLPAKGRHCKRYARLYPCGWRCDEHTPARYAGRDEPPTT